MSIKLMTLVWDAFPASGSELLCMLAMADWCDDRGGSLYPSMRAIAEKIRTSEKQARRIVQGLVSAGYLTVIGRDQGGAHGATKLFRVEVQKLHDLVARKEALARAAADHAESVETLAAIELQAAFDQGTPPTDGSRTPPTHGSRTPPIGVPDPSHPWEATPPTHGSQTVIEPSIEPSIRGTRAQAPATAPVFPGLDDLDAEPTKTEPPAIAEAQAKARPAQAAKPAAKTGVAAIERPEDVPTEVWGDFLAVRKAKRAPLTATAMAGIGREAGKAGITLEEALAVCCERGWVGFRADWYATSAPAAKTASRAFPRQDNFATTHYGPGGLL